MINIIVCGIPGAFDFADETDRNAEFVGKIGLGEFLFDSFLLYPVNHICIDLGFHANASMFKIGQYGFA